MRYLTDSPGSRISQGDSVPLASSLTGRLADEKRTRIVDLRSEEFSFSRANDFLMEGYQSGIATPLFGKEDVIGSFILFSKQADSYGIRDMTVLERLASQIAPAVENSRLYRDLQASIEEMAAVDEVARIITANLDINEAYEQFASEVKKLVGFDRCSVNLIDYDNGTLKLSHLSSIPGSRHTQGDTIPLEGSLSSSVTMDKRTIIFEDLSVGDQFSMGEHFLREGFTSAIATALISKEHVIGTFLLLSRQTNAFGLREKIIVERLAAQIAPSIENSLLFQRMEQLSLALESIGEAVAFLDLENKFKYVNREFQNMFGYSADEILDKSGTIVVPADQENQAEAGRVWSEGNASGWRGEVKRVRKDGQEIDVFVTMKPLKNKDGEVIGRIGVARDITESKRAEERLQETARLSSIGELAAGVAHEINNPLTSVLGFTQLLLLEDMPQEFRGDMETVHSEANRAAKVVQNLLSFARRHEPTMTNLDISSVIDRALDMKSYDFQVNNIRVIRDFSKDLSFVMADEQQMIQVFLNLLNNAEHAMSRLRGQGQITVRTKATDDGVGISISDDGPGIPDAHLPRIFEPFFTTKAVGEGTGLGLSVSYGIVNQHGGDIWADSFLGKGTTFHIELPVTDHEAGESSQTNVIQPPVSEAKRVLVVDDEPVIRQLLHRALAMDGLAVDLAEDGEEALRRPRSSAYDCIILDLKMPGMSGHQLYRAIGDQGGELTKKVIFITGDIASSDTLNFINQAGNLALTKPLDLDQVRQSVRSSLDPAGASP